MGTRSTTKIYYEKEFIMGLYKQDDGDTNSWGTELKNFINKCIIVNGISSIKEEEAKKNNKILCNGIGCFALQLVKEFKNECGGLYATNENNNQEYNYIIKFEGVENDKDKIEYFIKLSCIEDNNFKFRYKMDYGL